MDKIHLYWYKHKERHGNFGDELNPYIISKLTNLPIEHINIEYLKKDKYLVFKILLNHLINKKINFNFFIKYLSYNFIKTPEVFLCIGSVLQFCYIDKAVVWGSGMLSSDSKLPNAKYLAVRGYKTIDRINQLGYTSPQIVGDPAILLPKLYAPSSPRAFSIGIIPHYLHFNACIHQFKEDVVIVNLLDKIEDILDTVVSCNLIISTSLHGLIVAHSYGIKAIWATSKSKQLSGDDIKFYDYFSSVGIKSYQPIILENILGSTTEDLLQNITSEYKEVLLPKMEKLVKIQNDLIKSFPYKITQKNANLHHNSSL